MTKQERMIYLHEQQGYSLQKIANMYGISRQRVHQIIGKEVKENRTRRRNVEIENVKFKGIYEYLRDNPEVTYSAIFRKITGNDGNIKRAERFAKFLHSKGDNGKLTIGQIKRLSELTGKTFEELFEGRD